MKDNMKPILFSAPMGQAILDNRKTQTRRVVKYNFNNIYDIACAYGKWHQDYGKTLDALPQSLIEWYIKEIAKPRYQLGDILWVQETWKCIGLYGDYGYEVKFLDDTQIKFRFDDKERAHKWIKYHDKNGWQSPYFMPKEAARIFLRVTDVRAERLQEISTEDCIAEGIEIEFPQPKPSYLSLAYSEKVLKPAFIDAYRKLWNTLNAKRDGGIYVWEQNPWVRAIEFERIEKPEG